MSQIMLFWLQLYSVTSIVELLARKVQQSVSVALLERTERQTLLKITFRYCEGIIKSNHVVLEDSVDTLSHDTFLLVAHATIDKKSFFIIFSLHWPTPVG